MLVANDAPYAACISARRCALQYNVLVMCLLCAHPNHNYALCCICHRLRVGGERASQPASRWMQPPQATDQDSQRPASTGDRR